MGTTSRQIGTAAVWSVGARVGRFILGLASSVLVVRSLGDHDYGVLSLVRTVLMFVVMVGGAGMGHAVLKFVPMLRVKGAPVAARGLVWRVFGFSLAAWAALTACAVVLSGWLEGLFAFEGIGALIALGVSLAAFEMLFTLLSQFLYSAYDTRLQSIASLGMHVVYIVALLVLLPRGFGVTGVIIASAAGYLFAAAAIVGQVPRTVRLAPGDGADERVGTRRLLRYSLPLTAISVLNIIVWRQSETLFLAHFRSAAETGYFDLAYRMPQTILEFIPGTVWPLVMAGVSEVYTQNVENLRVAVDRYYRVLFLLCAPVCMTGIVLGGRMIEILFGEQMLPAAVPTQVFFAIFTMSFFATPLSMSLYVLEKTHINLGIYAVLATVNVGLDLLLIPRYGVAGAMVPVAAVIAVSPFLYAAAVRREVPGMRIPLRFIARCFAASSAVLVLVPALRFVTGVVELAAAVVVALLLLVLSFRLARVLGPAEHDLLESIPVPAAGRLLKFMSS
jgi:O-antigen/teichoic acid export membrane protein